LWANEGRDTVVSLSALAHKTKTQYIMAKEKVEVSEEVVVPTEKKSAQKVRWEAFLEAHKKQNPVKHEQRLKEGLTMPDNF